MRDELEALDEDDFDEELEDAEVDRAPQPGNTPAPDEPSYERGAITSPETRRPLDR
jgi:hypothetical protein